MKGYLSFRIYGLVLVAALLLVYSGNTQKAEAAVNKITQSKAQTGNVTPGDAPGFPVTISVKGSYMLDSNLTVSSNKNGIEITADNVTLDLNGFTIEGSGGTAGFGVYAGNATRVTIQNGKIMNMPSTGIHVGTNARIERMAVTQNGGYSAIGIGEGSTIVNSIVSDNSGIGINTGNYVVVTGNTVTHNDLGISIGSGIVSGNTVSDNDSYGIYVYYSGLVIGNTISENSGTGLYMNYSTAAGYRENVIHGNLATVYGGKNMGNNLCNGSLTCP
jgi:parallel beta-helix repeat protein